jgi:hypothetical protein
VIDAQIGQLWPSEVVEAVARFQQGHLVIRPPFFYAAAGKHGVWKFTQDQADPALSSELLEIDPEDCPPFGLITTQTCDLNEQGSRRRQPWLSVVPVYEASTLINPSQMTPLERGMIGHLVRLEPPSLGSGLWVADLRIEFPLEKSWLVGREPIEAFPDEAGYLGLARRLSRRRERPALANSLSLAIVMSLRKKFGKLSKKRKQEVLDPVREIRLFIGNGTRIAPNTIQLLVIGHTDALPDDVTEWFASWWDEARAECAQNAVILLANRYGALDTLTAADYVASIPLDFEFLSPDG